MRRIPFNIPYVAGQELIYMQDALSRNKISGDGHYTRKASKFMEETFRAKKVMLTTSCSSALDMAAILIGLKEGEEVIMPSFTFVSTANAVMLRGARPVFAEISKDTLNIDPVDIEKRITNKTRAIFPVHYAGVSCEMDRIMDIAKRYDLIVVEDAAQGVYAKYRDRYLGTIGDIGCYSFHETKNYTCGEGGAIILNTGDDQLNERAEIIREKGTNRSKFFRGEVDKYTWVDIGSSYLPSDILAAFLSAQLERLEEIKKKRQFVYERYYTLLKELENREYLRLPIIPEDCESNYHMFYILLNSEAERNRLMIILKEKGVSALFHYIPLNISPMGQSLGYKLGDFPITENLSGRLLRLPIYAGIGTEDIDYVIECIYKSFK